MTDIIEPNVENTNIEAISTLETAEQALTPSNIAEAMIGEEVSAPVAIDPQEAANKTAIEASGFHHLDNIFKIEINNYLGKIAALGAQIIRAAERTENWTFAEVKAIWDRIKAEI